MPRLFRLTPYALPFAALFGLFAAGSAQADLRACNQTNDTISVAIGYNDNDTWMSEGWWTMRAGDCKNMVPGDLKQRYYYWRATQNGNPLPTEEYYFCTSSKVFTIVGDTDCEARGYDRVAFSQVDTGDARTFTINVSGSAGPSTSVDDGLGDIHANMQGNWFAKGAPSLRAVVSGREITLLNDGEKLDTIGFDVAQTCAKAEGDGPVLLIDAPAEGAAPDCWLLVNASRDAWEIYIYSTGEGATFLRQN